MDVSQRRELSRDLNRQSGSFELALVPLIFGGLGWLVDRWLGVMPLFTLVLLVVGAIGVVTSLWIGYDRDMRRHEEEGPWSPSR
ncbi:MAG: hypothetical protein GEV08_09335 [Acidimicrobiia bacterium]|nr:hypothetical protein [Acidimicrobiia bacterium]